VTCGPERKGNCSGHCGLSPSDAIVISDEDDVVCNDLPGKESYVMEKKNSFSQC